jgi:hypothetical protein
MKKRDFLPFGFSYRLAFAFIAGNVNDCRISSLSIDRL